MQKTLFYKPIEAWAADFIPFYKDNVFYLYYLKDFRNHKMHGEGTPWYLVKTRDFINFEELGEVIERGNKDQQDLYVFTGSVIHYEGKFHIFYTGHNPHLMQKGMPQEAVMHAVSYDGIHYQKTEKPLLFAPDKEYERHDWRDPYVYYDPQRQCFNMLLAARKLHGSSRRRGLTANCISSDLLHWEVDKPLWDPSLYYTHECPDFFTIGDKEYLVFSEFSSTSCTRYVMRTKGEKDFCATQNDRFDGRAFYAAKTAYDGNQRFIFGWIPTKEGETDTGAWQWGGCLNVHEVYALDDGSLAVREPKSITEAFSKNVNHLLEIRTCYLNAMPGYANKLLGVLPDTYRLEMELQHFSDAGECAIVLNADENLEEGYELRLEFSNNRLVFDCWPRPGDQAYYMGLERPIESTSNKHYLSITVSGTAGCAYVDNKVALSFRMYRKPGAHLGILARHANVRMQNLNIMMLAN